MAIPPYTVIPDGRLQPDAPVRSVDALALRDNPLAIAQADEADATPQVYTDGIADGAVTSDKISTGMLFSLCGQIYNEAVAAFEYIFTAYRNTGGGGEERIVQDIYFFIPPGATTIAVRIKAAVDNPVLGDKYLDIELGAAAEKTFALTATYPTFAWHEVEFLVANTGTGLRQLVIDTDNNSANARDFYVAGIVAYIKN